MSKNQRNPVMRKPFGDSSPKGAPGFRIVKNESNSSTTDIYIHDEIGYWGIQAKHFIQQLLLIDSDKINVHINSPGGEVFDGVAIYNALKTHKAEVTVIVDALAASAASFIAQAGDKVVMTRNATMMIHDGMALCYGNAADMEYTKNILDKLSNNIADIYYQHAGGSVEEWRAFMQEEVWYNAEEAVEAGLADEVLDMSNDEAEAAKNRWDLSVFNYSGRDEAPSPADIRNRLTNQIKEASMGTTKTAPKNGGEGDPQETPAVEPATTQPVPESPASPDVEVEEEEEPTSQVTDPPVVPAAAKVTVQGSAAFTTFKMNGVEVTDFTAVQNHINGLEQFRKETLENARKSFVEQLVKDNKVAATQVKELEEFALDLSDSQYEKWTASWNAAPVLGLFGSHASGTANHETPQADAVKDEIEVLEGTIRQHKLAGMTNEKIEQTPSYKRLMQLKPEFKL